MAITAADIHNQSFSIDRKGYDVDEVDVFLEHVADEIDGLNQHIASLEAQLNEARFDGFDTPAAPVAALTQEIQAFDTSEYEADIAKKDALIADLQRQLDEKKADDSAIAQALIIAQRSADDILVKANAQATDTIQDAREEAARILDRANLDRQDVLDSIRKLQDDREDAREEYSDLLKDIIADASRKLASIGAAANQEPEMFNMTGVSPADITAGFEIDEEVTINPAAAYTVPQASETVVAAATPVASVYEKDLSGFGDADDSFTIEEID